MRSSCVVFFIVVILAGCSPQKRLARLLDRYPLPKDTLIEYRDTTIYKDSIVIERIKGDTVRDSIYVPFEVDLPDMELKAVSTWAYAYAGLRDNSLWLELVQRDSVLEFKLDSAYRQDIDTVFMEVITEVPVVEKVGQFWKHGFLVLAGLILISIVLLLLLWKK